ncbi:hypothetical protein DFH06DRAFT_1328694 [Mycena polygramma]|nr:hypothetical protein DFH06DRAFT_1328694 [Mycena polygramma]
MGTPSLWATIEVDSTYRHYDSDLVEKFILQSLERAADFPLAVRIAANDDHYTTQNIEILARHSHRWRSADIYTCGPANRLLRSIEGCLPVLERLDCYFLSFPESCDVFKVAPKLTHVALVGGPPTPTLPWEQLREVAYNVGYCNDLTGLLTVMQHCSQQCAFKLDDFKLSADFSIPDISPIHSDIWSLDLGLSRTLATITLPSLRRLRFRFLDLKGHLRWPHTSFLAFAARSSLQTTLTTLSLHRMVVTEDELVECLLELPSLLDLSMQDVPSCEEHTLITDSLFQRLTWTSDPSSLVPCLSSFHMASLFRFDHRILLNFVMSRIVPGKTNGRPFALEMKVLEWKPEVEVEVLARTLDPLRDEGKLRWSLE